jgi:hypothetical protein
MSRLARVSAQPLNNSESDGRSEDTTGAVMRFSLDEIELVRT